MDVPVYMEQPEGFIQGDHNKIVCLLNKSLSGSKQGGYQGNKRLHKVLTKLNFMRTYSDASLYIYRKGDIKIIMPIFVDNMTLASKSELVPDKFIIEVGEYFKLRDLGPTNQLLGIKIDCDCSCYSISLSQKRYTSRYYSISAWNTANPPQLQWSWGCNY